MKERTGARKGDTPLACLRLAHPFFSCAHYFQAPATQAIYGCINKLYVQINVSACIALLFVTSKNSLENKVRRCMNSKHFSGQKNTSYKRFARKFLHIVQLHHNVASLNSQTFSWSIRSDQCSMVTILT